LVLKCSFSRYNLVNKWLNFNTNEQNRVYKKQGSDSVEYCNSFIEYYMGFIEYLLKFNNKLKGSLSEIYAEKLNKLQQKSPELRSGLMDGQKASFVSC